MERSKAHQKNLLLQLSICTCGFSCLMLKVYYCSFGDLSFSVWSWTANVFVFLEDILRNNFFLQILWELLSGFYFIFALLMCLELHEFVKCYY